MSRQTPRGSAASAGTGAQRPRLPGTLHAWQLGQELDSQQTPSVQLLPIWHSFESWQAAPPGLRPQAPPRQT